MLAKIGEQCFKDISWTYYAVQKLVAFLCFYYFYGFFVVAQHVISAYVCKSGK